MQGLNGLTFFGFFALLLARTVDSIGRIPADPGYQYIQEAAQFGLRSVFFGDPYFHLVTRLMAWVTTWSPLGWHAVILSLMAHALWSGCAVAIANVVWRETSKRWVGTVSGLFLVTAPHASESILGSIGSIKWPLLSAAIIICSSSRTLLTRPISAGALLIAVGLTQPLTFVCLLPLLWIALRHSDVRPTAIRLCAIVSLTLLAQVLKVGLESASSGRTARITEPWSGMGVFWWSGLFGPIIVSSMVALTALFQNPRRVLMNSLSSLLCVTAVTTCVFSYLMGGIADRYFVAPLTLSFVAATILLSDARSGSTLRRVSLATTFALVVLIPTVKWFPASWYLTGGPTWSSEVARAKAVCSTSGSQQVSLTITVDSTVELECEYVLRG